MRHNLDWEKFEHKGRVFEVALETDDTFGEPWKEHDGHGIVTDWLTRDKEPGERILCEDRRTRRYYDFARTMKIARRDGWGLSPEHITDLQKRLGRPPTQGDITAESVQRDFDFLRRWCAGDWYYVGVIVRQEGHDEERSVWGVESDADYPREVARELADELLYCARQAAARKGRETRERNYWAARDVLTIA